MVGDPIERVQDGITTILRELRTDPTALETVYISILIFAGKARRLAPLMELTQFYPPRLPIGGGTSLGDALYLLMDDIEKNTVQSSTQVKGDWKPLVFLLTDGAPTDDYSAALYAWKTRFSTRANLVAIAFGEGADLQLLSDLTDHVYRFDDTDPAAYARFFRWISQSVKSSSIAVNAGQGDGINLSKVPDDGLKKVDFAAIQHRRPLDDRYAVLLGKCQQTERPYLMKYVQTQRPGDETLAGLNLQTREYRLVGSFPVDNQYFELADSRPANASINTDELVGFPSCPHCHNPYAFSLCTCGNLFCTANETVSRCPWCQQELEMGTGDGSANINRTTG